MCRQLSQKKRRRFVKGTAEEEEKSKEKKKGYAADSQETTWFAVAKRCERKKEKGGTTCVRSAEKLYVSLRKREGNLLLEQQVFLQRPRREKRARAIHHTLHTRVWLMQTSQSHTGFRRLASLVGMLMCAFMACTLVGGQSTPHSDVTRTCDDARAAGVSTIAGHEVPYDDGPDGRSRGVSLFDLSPLDPTDGPCESIVDDEACYRRCGCEWCGPGRGHGCHSIPPASAANATGPCADGKSGRRDAFWSCHREAVAWIAGGIVGAMAVAFFVGVAFCWCHRKKVAARCCTGCCGADDRSRRRACINNDDGAGGDVWLGGYVSMPRYVNP